MQNTGLDDSQAGFKFTVRNIDNLRYADVTTLMAESEKELEPLDEGERGEWNSWLKIQHSSWHPIPSHYGGKKGKRWYILFSWTPKSLQMMTSHMFGFLAFYFKWSISINIIKRYHSLNQRFIYYFLLQITLSLSISNLDVSIYLFMLLSLIDLHVVDSHLSMACMWLKQSSIIISSRNIFINQMKALIFVNEIILYCKYLELYLFYWLFEQLQEFSYMCIDIMHKDRC